MSSKEYNTDDGNSIKGVLSTKGVMTYEIKYVVDSDREKFKDAIQFVRSELNKLRDDTLLSM